MTRIELQDGDATHYAALDRAMVSRNFSRTHVSGRGVAYQLPDGTYFSQSTGLSSTDVRNLAVAAARNIGCRYDIVTMSGDMAYFLHPAR